MSALRKLTRCFTSAGNFELKSLATSIQNDIDNLRPTSVFVDSSVGSNLSKEDAYKIQAHTRQVLAQALFLHLPSLRVKPSPYLFFTKSNAGVLWQDSYLHSRHRELREARGEKCVGFKIGCTSRAIQTTFGLDWYYCSHFVSMGKMSD